MTSSQRQADLLLANAGGFLAAARHGRDPNGRAHALAIAAELSLKAFLSHEGVATPVLVAIGHDLRLAEALARGLGLDLAPGCRDAARFFDPHFREGGFQQRPATPWSPAALRRVSRQLAVLAGRVRRRLDGTDARRYRTAIAQLRPVPRAVLERSLDEETLATIAAALGIGVEAVQDALAEALVALDTALR